MLVFVGIVVAILGVAFVQSASVQLLFLYVSNKLHNLMLSRVVHAPLSFFDSNPLGRIINRFSSDVATADLAIPVQFKLFFDVSTCELSLSG